MSLTGSRYPRTSKYSRALDLSWACEPMFDGCVDPNNMRQMFQCLPVLIEGVLCILAIMSNSLTIHCCCRALDRLDLKPGLDSWRLVYTTGVGSFQGALVYRYVASGPLVRSSYKAGEFFLEAMIKKDRTKARES
jgi:hypothetical protein